MRLWWIAMAIAIGLTYAGAMYVMPWK